MSRRRDARALARGAAACWMVVARVRELVGEGRCGEARGLLRTMKPLGVRVDARSGDARRGEGEFARGLSLTWYTGRGIAGLGLFLCGDCGDLLLKVSFTQYSCCLALSGIHNDRMSCCGVMSPFKSRQKNNPTTVAKCDTSHQWQPGEQTCPPPPTGSGAGITSSI